MRNTESNFDYQLKRHGSEFLSKGSSNEKEDIIFNYLVLELKYLKKLNEKSIDVKCFVPENLSQFSQGSVCAKFLEKWCTKLYVKYRKNKRFKKQNILLADDLMLYTISYFFLITNLTIKIDMFYRESSNCHEW